jgi:DNA-binding NarL/FixJ family response regulator
MRALIADRNHAFRAVVAELIRVGHPGAVMREATSTAEMMNVLADGVCDVLFLDLDLVGSAAVAALAHLAASYPDVKIVALGEGDDRDIVIACLDAGLHGYIPRATPINQLAKAMRVIGSDGVFVSPIAAKLATDGHVSHAGLSRPEPTRSVALTARQVDVLRLLAEGRSTKDIARRLGLAVPTVKTHLAALYRQLGVRNRVEAVIWASGHRPVPEPATPDYLFALGNPPPLGRRILPA